MRSKDGCLDIFPLREWGSILVVLIIFVTLGGILSQIGQKSSGPRVCTHAPHLGICKIQDMVMLFDAGTKTMQPSWFTCGCTSDHGVRIQDTQRTKED